MGASQVNGSTIDLNEELLSQLRDLVPAAFPDGELDVTALVEALGVSTGPNSSFSFAWPGLEQARIEARRPTTTTLTPDPEASLNWDTSRDVLIEGDNLQVLKLLKNGYNRSVKLIYIDPPYNTGDAFTYKDDYAIPEEEYLKTSGQIDAQGNATTSKVEKAGRKHAPWLSFMFPRLALARHLLRRDGVLLVSIDDNEAHHLRLLLDALFGSNNFLGSFVWEGGRKNDARRISVGHDYMWVYARDLAFLKDRDVKWREKKTGLSDVYAKEKELLGKHGADYEAATEELRAWYKSLPEGSLAKQHEHYRFLDAGGVWYPDNISSPNLRENLRFPWRVYEPPANGWRYDEAAMQDLDDRKLLIYPDTTEGRIQYKRYLHETEYWAPASVFYKDRRAASKALEALMGKAVFDFPKDVDVLARLVEAITDTDDIIVDFFAGSGSTGHAVWQQSRNDSKPRRWVMVQAAEPPNDNDAAGMAAIHAGYKSIFEITAERMRRAAKLFKDRPLLGFRVFRAHATTLQVAARIVAKEDMTGEQYVDATLTSATQSPVKEGAQAEHVLWEILLKATSSQLDAVIVEHSFEGIKVFEVKPQTGDDSGTRLLVSLDAFDLHTADALALTEKDTLILRSDRISDATTLTLAPRLQSKLILLERIPREVSL